MTEATRVYTELKRDIVTCSLAPGLSLSELEMFPLQRQPHSGAGSVPPSLR